MKILKSALMTAVVLTFVSCGHMGHSKKCCAKKKECTEQCKLKKKDCKDRKHGSKKQCSTHKKKAK